MRMKAQTAHVAATLIAALASVASAQPRLSPSMDTSQ